jgi:hypothetical protein
MEVLTVNMVYNHIDYKCMHLRLTVFDYAKKRFQYVGTYKLLDNVEKYNVHILAPLVKPSLAELPFENPPFEKHIALIQSIIDYNLPEEQV